jgi:hypothetical protein
MKRFLSLAMATGVLLATAGVAEARTHNYWRTYPSVYNYGYSSPYAGYYPPQAYGNYNYGYYGTNPYYNGINPYYGYNYGRGNTLRQIGNALLRNLF